SSFHGRTSLSICKVSRTEGCSKKGVTTTVRPLAGMIAAVTRSERCQRTPVKYSSEVPDSIRKAPILCCCIRDCTLAMRASRSWTEIGCALLVRELRRCGDASAATVLALEATAAAAAAPSTARRETVLIGFGFLASVIRLLPRSRSGRGRWLWVAPVPSCGRWRPRGAVRASRSAADGQYATPRYAQNGRENSPRRCRSPRQDVLHARHRPSPARAAAARHPASAVATARPCAIPWHCKYRSPSGRRCSRRRARRVGPRNTASARAG